MEIFCGVRCIVIELVVVVDVDGVDFVGGYFGELLVQDLDFGFFGGLICGVGCGLQVCWCGGGDYFGFGCVVVVVDYVVELVYECDYDIGLYLRI